MPAASGVPPPPGAYRCRTVKLGSQSETAGEEAGLGYVVYGWFACRIEQTPEGLRFIKLTGSQRPSGRLFADTDRRMILLGAMALGGETTSPAYGQSADRDAGGAGADRRTALAAGHALAAGGIDSRPH